MQKIQHQLDKEGKRSNFHRATLKQFKDRHSDVQQTQPEHSQNRENFIM